MKNKKFLYIIMFIAINLFFYQCGRRYIPETIQDDRTKKKIISKERKVLTNKKEIIKVEMKKTDEIVNEKVEEIVINPKKYDIFQKGIASWYGGKFQGRRTANGEIYDKYKLTAAHKTLPFNSIIEVTNHNNSKKVIVRINDRGPFVKGRIIDLSKKAANMIDMEDTGTAPVSLKILNKDALNKLHKTIVFSDAPPKLQTQTNNIQSTDPIQWFYIQAGAFKDKINAVRLLDKIQRLTDVKFLIKRSNSFFKVISVKLSSKSLAVKISSDLKEYYIDTFVKSF